VFLSVLKALEKDGGGMVLCAMQPFVADVFEISGFSGAFHDRRDARRGVRAALASASGSPRSPPPQRPFRLPIPHAEALERPAGWCSRAL
jgi:hypothetical protein